MLLGIKFVLYVHKLYYRAIILISVNKGFKLAGNKVTGVTWAQMVRDVLIVAMNKGQLLPIFLFAIAILIIFKMPDSAIVKLVNEVLEKLIIGELWAYILVVILSLSWFSHAKKMRIQYSKELDRIGLEKSKLQQVVSKKKFVSSSQKGG